LAKILQLARIIHKLFI